MSITHATGAAGSHPNPGTAPGQARIGHLALNDEEADVIAELALLYVQAFGDDYAIGSSVEATERAWRCQAVVLPVAVAAAHGALPAVKETHIALGVLTRDQAAEETRLADTSSIPAILRDSPLGERDRQEALARTRRAGEMLTDVAERVSAAMQVTACPAKENGMSTIHIPAEAITDVRWGAINLLGDAAEELARGANDYAFETGGTDEDRRSRYYAAFERMRRLQAFIGDLGDHLAVSPAEALNVSNEWAREVEASAEYTATDLHGRLSEGERHTSTLRPMVDRLEHLEALLPVAVVA